MRHAFHADEFEKFLAFAPSTPLIYKHNSLTLQVAEDRLIFGLATASDQVFANMELMCLEVLRNLPVTPVSAVGLNFGFSEEAPGDALLELFNSPDNQGYIAQDWNIDSCSILRSLRRADMTLNFTLTLEGGTVKIDANFHNVAPTVVAAMGIIEGHCVEKRDLLLQILTDIYGLHLQGI